MADFFIPNIAAADQEAAYRELAALVGAGVPQLERRISSISWRHDGVDWTATVGEGLRGAETVTKGRGRDKRYITIPRSTNETQF